MKYPHDTKLPASSRFRPICVFTMGKVGGMSLVYHLRNTYKNVFCQHEFHVDESRDNAAKPPDINGHRERNRLIKQFLQREATQDDPALVISLVRDPGARIVSSFFFSIQLGLMKNSPISRIKNPSSQDYSRAIESEYDLAWHTDWYERQMLECYGVDVFQFPFPKEVGWQVIHHGNVKLLLVRTEDLDIVSNSALSSFFGKQFDGPIPRRNVTHTKDYAKFREKIVLSDDVLNKLYDNRQVKHFYTDEEIDAFRKRWTDE